MGFCDRWQHLADAKFYLEGEASTPIYLYLSRADLGLVDIIYLLILMKIDNFTLKII